MRCPDCKSEKLSVIETRSDAGSIRRRRECQECNKRFSTYERIEIALPMVLKKGGRLELFKSEKIRQGLVRACQKRPVTLDQIDATVSDIEQEVAGRNLSEMPSEEIGELVLNALKNLDVIAYVRFISVYREFSSLDQFLEVCAKA